MRTITSEFTEPTFEEYEAAFSRTTEPRRSQMGALILSAIAAILALVAGTGLIQVILALVAAGLVIVAIRVPKDISRAWVRHTIRLENREMFGHARSVIDDRGIQFEHRSGRTEFYPWHPILLVEDVGGLRLMHVGANSAAFVLRRTLSAEDWSEWTEFLKATFPAEKLKLDN